MKLKTFLMVAIVALCSVSCNNNDDVTPVADSVVGTYNCTLDMKVAGNSAGSSELTVVMTKTSDATISMDIVNNGEQKGGMSINKIELDGITVTDTGNSTYALSKDVPDGGFTATDKGSAAQTVWTFKSFSGSVEGGSLSLTMIAQPGAMPMPITMVFAGSKK